MLTYLLTTNIYNQDIIEKCLHKACEMNQFEFVKFCLSYCESDTIVSAIKLLCAHLECFSIFKLLIDSILIKLDDNIKKDIIILLMHHINYDAMRYVLSIWNFDDISIISSNFMKLICKNAPDLAILISKK